MFLVIMDCHQIKIIREKTFGIPQKILIPIISFLFVPDYAYMLSAYKAIGGGDSILGDQGVVNVFFKLIAVIVLVYLGYIMTKLPRRA